MINQLDARNGHAQLDGLNDGLHGSFDAGERADGGRNGFGQRVQPHGDFCHDTESAFAAYKQASEVVTRTGFFGARTRANDFACCRDHFQCQDVFAHGAIANRIGATGPSSAHAANGGVCARIDREEQTG